MSEPHLIIEAIDDVRRNTGLWPFGFGDRVRKISGSSWQGHVVGFYSTLQTPVGYCVESEREPGSVQIYPARALQAVPPA